MNIIVKEDKQRRQFELSLEVGTIYLMGIIVLFDFLDGKMMEAFKVMMRLPEFYEILSLRSNV